MAPPVVFEISITNGDRPFNPGGFITGKVVIQTTRRERLRAIRLLFYGNSYATPPPSSMGMGKFEPEPMIERHAECKVDLWGGHGGMCLLESGRYTFPFALKLPQVSLPTSFESTAGAVRYWLEARMEKEPYSYTTTKEFIIQERVDLNNESENLFLPRSAEIRKTFRTITGRSGPLVLAASTDRSGYCPGEKILVSVRLDNTSNKEIKKVKASLLCCMTYFRRYEPHTVDTLVAQLRMCQPIDAGRHEIWVHHPLPIPAAILPSSHASIMIHRDYVLVVKASTPALTGDVSVALPIVIGTEPLRPQWQSLGRSLSLNPRYEAPAVEGNEELGTFVRRETWAGLPSYSLLPMASVGTPVSAAMLPEPDEPPPMYTPYPTSEVGPPTYSQSPLSADHPNIAQCQMFSLASSSVSATPQVPLTGSPHTTATHQVSSTASRSVTATSQVFTTTSQSDIAAPQVSLPASATVSATPQVPSPALPNTVTTPQVSSTASPNGTATPQLSSTASLSVSATPQVSSAAPPNIITTPQVSSTASPSVTATPQVSSTASPSVSATSQVTSPAPSNIAATPQVSSPASPNIAATPQISSAESCIAASHPVSSFASPNATLRVSLPPHVTQTAPQVSPGRPHVSSYRSQIFLDPPLVQLSRPRRTASLSATSGRQRPSHRSAGNSVLARFL